MAARSGQDMPELLTAAQMARELHVSPSTIWNWTRLERNPLKTVTTADDAVRFSWMQLEEFREANPRLPGLNKVQVVTGYQPPQALPAAAQVEELKSIARDLRNAANASLQAALEAARLNEESARSHRVQLEQIAQTVAALDAALATFTAPSTMND
jgi:hypothetical protein